MQNQNCVCIIPARGGSKRIKRKNLKSFCGKPILAYSIENAKKCGIFSEIIVSSEDAEILEFARKCGVSAQIRSQELSDDYAGTHEVILFAIEQLEQQRLQTSQNAESQNTKPHTDDFWVCCLYATAPLLESNALQNAFEIAKNKAQSCYCFGAVEYDYSPYRAFRIVENQNKMLFNEHFSKRSQDLEKIYHDAGQFYFAKKSIWQSKANIFENSISFLLPPSRVCDIDTLEDWELAELKFKLLNP